MRGADAMHDVISIRVSPDAVRNLGELDDDVMAKAEAIIRQSRDLNWKVVQRGFWVHGTPTLREYLASTELFTINGRAEMIRCPTLFTQAENDTLAKGAGAFFEALKCPKTQMRFSAEEGAGDHCEMTNRSLLNRRVFDWLDDLFM